MKVIYGPLKTVNAEDIAAEIKPMMGKYSWITPQPHLNQLMLLDQASSLRAVVEYLE